jgi:adenine-specific DNA-methyltransferase
MSWVPPLIEKDEWGNAVISDKFNAGMLAEAVCKLEGFTYSPSDQDYWMHGHSTESDFIYVTTEFLSKQMLEKISEEVGPDRTLLICCGSFKADVSVFENLTVKKIPNPSSAVGGWFWGDFCVKTLFLG